MVSRLSTVDRRGVVSWAGPLWLVTAVLQAYLQRGAPGRSATGDDVLAWMVSNRRRYLVGQVIGSAGFAALYLPFLGHVTSGDGDRGWRQTALAAGLLAPAAGIAGGSMLCGLAVTSKVDRDTARLAVAAGSYAFNASGTLLGVVPGAMAMAQRAEAPRAIQALAAATTTGALAGAGAVLEDRPGPLTWAASATWAGVAAWVLATSIQGRQSRP